MSHRTHPKIPLSPEAHTFEGAVQSAVVRNAATPDAFSTKTTAELEATLRDTRTLPLESLLNTDEVAIDFVSRRIWRDSFWKGSFAADTLLGWEERVRTAALGGSAETLGAQFAGGSFWKRFDRIEDGAARGHVVNYEIAWLPGDPAVREVSYPDDNRRYFQMGDRVLLLRYLNEPYRIVYDAIKVIDRNNAIGVMHLGEFPHGVVFSAFVLARNNYPFEKMSSQDHDLLFVHEQAASPSPNDLAGEWTGTLVIDGRPSLSLLNQANLSLFRVTFAAAPAGVEARYRIGVEGDWPELSRSIPAGEIARDLRLIDGETLLGRWPAPAFADGLLNILGNYFDLPESPVCRFVLIRRRV